MFTPQEAAGRIAELAMRKGISINKLLLSNGLSKKVVDNMKVGKMPSADRLAVIALALGTDVFDLLGMEQAENMHISGDITSSNVVQGTNRGTLIVRNGDERGISGEEIELLRIYNGLDVRTRHQFMAVAFGFEKNNLYAKDDLFMSAHTTKLGEYVKALRGDMSYDEFLEKTDWSLTPHVWSQDDVNERGVGRLFVELLEGADATLRILVDEKHLKRFVETTKKEFGGQHGLKGYTEVAALAEESGWVFEAYDDNEIRRIQKQIDNMPQTLRISQAYIDYATKKSLYFAYKPTAKDVLELSALAKKQPEHFTGIVGDVANTISGNITNSAVVQGANFGTVETNNGRER
jgi:hypothetical protein